MLKATISDRLYVPAEAITSDDILKFYVEKKDGRTGTWSRFYTAQRSLGGLWALPVSQKLDYSISRKIQILDQRTGEKFDSPAETVIELESRDYQKVAVSSVVSQLKSGKNGILKSGCGSGKTTMSLLVSKEIGMKTAILVGTDQLKDQWVAPVRNILGKEPKVFNGKSKDADSDVVIFSIPSLLNVTDKFRKEALSKFGLVIADECHSLGAEEWGKSISCFSGKYRLGLSATPHRADNMHELVFLHIGPVFHEVPTKMLEEQGHILKSKIILRRYPKDSSAYRKRWKTIMGRKFCSNDYDFVETCTQMSLDPDRNRFIAGLIKEANSKGRTTLSVTIRLNHFEEVPKALKSLGSDIDFGLVKSGANFKSEIAKDNVIAIQILGKQGLDKPDLETIFMLTPISDEAMLEQLRGRLSRKSSGKKTPVLVDIVDSVVRLDTLVVQFGDSECESKMTPLERQLMRRLAKYIEMDCEIYIEDVDQFGQRFVKKWDYRKV